MSTFEQLQMTLGQLGLTALEARMEGLLENASKRETSYGDFLLGALSLEAGAANRGI